MGGWEGERDGGGRERGKEVGGCEKKRELITDKCNCSVPHPFFVCYSSFLSPVNI